MAYINQQGGVGSQRLQLLTDSLEQLSLLVLLSDACPGGIKYRGKHALQGHAGVCGVVLAPGSCGTDLGSIR